MGELVINTYYIPGILNNVSFLYEIERANSNNETDRCKYKSFPFLEELKTTRQALQGLLINSIVKAIQIRLTP